MLSYVQNRFIVKHFLQFSILPPKSFNRSGNELRKDPYIGIEWIDRSGSLYKH